MTGLVTVRMWKVHMELELGGGGGGVIDEGDWPIHSLTIYEGRWPSLHG